ncbi:aspartate aminotransferase family protein [Bacillus tianshenii]|nr:aspartate aminotransferase family protein [Bacillus tianshenii]
MRQAVITEQPPIYDQLYLKNKHLFLHNSRESSLHFKQAVQHVQNVLEQDFALNDKPYSGLPPEAVAEQLKMHFKHVLPNNGMNLETVFEQISQVLVKNSVVVTNPACAAHLHCPPLSAAAATELLIGCMNQSMDSWDQSGAATLLEQQMVQWLCELFFHQESADGVFTSGGTQSNFMGLLLARDHYYQQHNWNVLQYGLPPEADKIRILCSEDAHFTVRQSAYLLGLGEQAVVTVDVDEQHRMSVEDLEQKIARLYKEGLQPIALVATAGTTDFGSIDPLNELGAQAKKHDLWFHVDAAYGGALQLTDESGKLNGIAEADSITVDFHKMFFQPISCGAFLIRDKQHFQLLKRNADYLNPEGDEEGGIPNLVTKSVQTTRRFDALKLFVSLQVLGQQTFNQLITYLCSLTKQTAAVMKDEPFLEVLHEPELTTIVFRYNPQPDKQRVRDDINQKIRTTLWEQGKAVVARTRVNGEVCLKLTLLNPRTSFEELQNIIQHIKELGEQFSKE